MINLYIGKENLPKDKHFIFDVDSAISLVNCSGTLFQRKVLEIVEKGSYYDSKVFTDRFGYNLYYDCMSSGSKALFELEGLDDVVNCDECGPNALKMVSLLKTCDFYLSFRQIELPYYYDAPIVCNGRYYESISTLNWYLR